MTPKDHPDYEDLCNALKLIRSVKAQAARVVEKRKNMNQVLEIQNTLVMIAFIHNFIHLLSSELSEFVRNDIDSLCYVVD